MSRPATQNEIRLARRLCPDLLWNGATVNEDGQFHTVLLANQHAVIRTARTPEATQDMPRSVRLHQLVAQQLNYQVPTPLCEIVTVHGLASVAMSFVPGKAHLPFSGDPDVLQKVVQDLASVTVEPLNAYLAEPFAYAGPWSENRRRATFDALPDSTKPAATRLWDQLEFLAQAPRGLVHGDLLGHNMHWQGSHLIGILDWDLASLWDPALNTSYLCFWHGYDLIDQISSDVDEAYRAKLWTGLMYLERLSSSLTTMNRQELDALLQKIAPRITRAAGTIR